MVFSDQESIEKFLDVAILERLKAQINLPANPIPILFKERTDLNLLIQTPRPAIPAKGVISFTSFRIAFKFDYQLESQGSDNRHLLRIPTVIEYADPRRKSIRLYFDETEKKTVRLWSERLKTQFNAGIHDLSNEGIGFYVLAPKLELKKNDLIYIKDEILGQTCNGFIKICHIDGELCGGFFSDVDESFKLSMNKVIKQEILWRLEQNLFILRGLKQSVVENREKMASSPPQEGNSKSFLDQVNPFLASVVGVIENDLKLPLEKKSTELVKVSNACYEASILISLATESCHTQFFICLNQQSFASLCSHLTLEVNGFSGKSTESVLKEVGKILTERICSETDKTIAFQISSPKTIISKRHLLSTLSRYPAIRICFSAAIGSVDMLLFLSEVISQYRRVDDLDLKDVFFEALYFVEPIHKSTVKVFSTFLGMEVKEKGINVRTPLAPKFEVSAFISFANQVSEGQLILNMSEKLARFIYKSLFQEEVDCMHAEIKDAIGEILNIIIGNAKEDLSQTGINFQLSTPFVIIGRDQFIDNAGNKAFVSSSYWSSEGFFELSFSVQNRISRNC